MNTKLFLSVFLSFFLFTNIMADNTLFIIKVNGSYGIMNKGKNQGMREGEVLYVKREGNSKNLCKVKILRTTANRAAIEQISDKKNITLLKGDQLFLESDLRSPINEVSAPVEEAAKTPIEKRKFAKNKKRNSTVRPITEPNAPKPKQTKLEASQPTSSSIKTYSPMRHFKKPWVTMEVGSIFPNGHFSELYSNSLQFNANYMVSVTDDVNLGIDISNTFLKNTDLTANFESSSMLTVAVMFQKFFGNYFFMEGGGGMFRPKVTQVSEDNSKSTVSQTNFGIIAGSGFFIPTSPYAGFTIKGKLHSYFDHYSKNYFGITGGFRFKIR